MLTMLIQLHRQLRVRGESLTQNTHTRVKNNKKSMVLDMITIVLPSERKPPGTLAVII